MKHRTRTSFRRPPQFVLVAGVVLLVLLGTRAVVAATASQSVMCSISSSKLTCPLPPPVTVTAAGPTVTVTQSAAATSSTTSSSPAPSPSQTAATGCLAVPSACGYPDATNTGATGPLTVWQGDYHTSSNGQTVTGLDIRGTLYIDNSNVTVSNVGVTEQGSEGWAVTIGANATAAHPLTGITLSYLTIDGGKSHGGGVQAPEGNVSWTLDHSDISNGENGIRSAGNATIRDCWVHDLAAGSGAHYDDVEIYAGTGDVYDHNTLTLGVGTGFTSAWNVQGDFAPVNQPTLSNSLLDGGGYTVNVRGIGAYPVKGAQLLGNRFGPDHAYGYSADDATGTTASGNVADLTGKNIDAQL